LITENRRPAGGRVVLPCHQRFAFRLTGMMQHTNLFVPGPMMKGFTSSG
jgi:hypothetical protein